ncbi:MAG: prolyl oligopeptidase family serine peptidase [Myxococcota bacterium]
MEWRWFLLALGFGLMVPPGAGAQTVSELREDLSRLEARSNGVPPGTLRSIAYTIDVAERIDGRFSEQSRSWRRRARRFLDAALEGRDPYPEARGQIVNRSYPQRLSTSRQGYAIYLPPDYDPSRSWPLLIVLHGGSSNGNLFLGVVLGNNMIWESYNQYLWNDFEARWKPNLIVAAPDGYGQVMWRWMGEQDVLDVIADITRHYNVDADRVVLMGLSNGGVGAYAIGTRHASRFSAVQAIAGSPSWLLYAGGRQLPEERMAMRPFSAMHLPENTTNTFFRFYHGRSDTGPMQPPFVERFETALNRVSVEPQVTWYDAGHDILYRVHRHGTLFDALAEHRRDRSPSEVRLQTGDLRAAQQHWVTVTRLERPPEIGRVHARVDGGRVEVDTEGVVALSFDLRDLPGEGDIAFQIDGAEAYRGSRDQLGHRLHFHRGEDGWTHGFPPVPDDGREKRPGLAGPLTDAYYERMVHVYGTGVEDDTAALRAAAERGSRGWPLWLWRFNQEVVADTEVDEGLMADAHLVLYGTPGANAVLDRIAADLPIQIDDSAVLVGGQRYEGRDVGTRFIYPNPLSPNRYVIVQAGINPRAVGGGNNLPDFLPDYVVYDAETTARRPRLTAGRNEPRTLGYFDRFWRLPPMDAEGGDPSTGFSKQLPLDGDAGGSPRDAGAADTGATEGEVEEEEPLLPIPRAPRMLPRPRTFLAPADDPAGAAARTIAGMVRTFHNFRAEIPGATWRVDRDAVWQIRAEAECHRELERLDIPFRARGEHPTPMPSPIELLGPIDGVWFRMMHDDRPIEISCELATRLHAMVQVLKRHGVVGVDVMSAYRDHPRPSFHTMGLGLDIGRFWTDRGWISVLSDFRETPAHYTCGGGAPGNWRGRRLLRITCDLYRERIFSSVLTPNYNEGHRNHFHLDVRPNDHRFFLR